METKYLNVAATDYGLKRRLNRMKKDLNRKQNMLNCLKYMIIAVSLIAIIACAFAITFHVKYTSLRKQYITLKQSNVVVTTAYDELYSSIVELQIKLDDVTKMSSEDIEDAKTAIDAAYIQYEEKAINNFTPREDIPLDADLQTYAYGKCQEIGFDINVFFGLIKKESTFRADVVSGTGDYGLCQINKSNHDWMQEIHGDQWDPMNPYDNIDASISILKSCIDSGYNEYHTILMAYNMGPGGANKCIQAGQYSSIYSRTIMGYAEEFGYDGTPFTPKSN